VNFYVVVEGRTEKTVYNRWIPLVNPDLSPITRIEQVANDHFFLLTGGGYPAYFDIVDDAITDVNEYHAFDRLVISVDSEEMSFHEKLLELENHIQGQSCRIEIKIVIQNFCFEAWALGNKLIIRPNTQSPPLIEYRQLHDVRSQDPELLPLNPKEDLTRAQFAVKYLRVALNDKHRNLTYTKHNPRALLHLGYVEQLRLRLDQTGHIASFSGFLEAFA